MEMDNATNGKTGYMGTLKGLSNIGSVFLSFSRAIMETMYNVSAPNTEMVMISEVFPVASAMMPIIIFTNNALAGV
jgi:hypothetical protein